MKNAIFIMIIALIIFLVIRVLYLFKEKIQFYTSGFDSGFRVSQISLLWKLSKNSHLTDPTSLFWSVPVLDKTIAQLINSEKLKGTSDSSTFDMFLSKLYKFRTKIELESRKKGLNSTKSLDSGQKVRVILRGSGVFSSQIVAVSRELVLSIPKKDGRIIISGIDWVGKSVNVYLWRKNDAAYVFDTVVKESGMYNGNNVLYLEHSLELLRTQKRKSIRTACHIYAQMYVIRSETSSPTEIETEPGLKCLINDISEDGALIRIGGKGVKNMQIKLQFTLAGVFILMAGFVRGVDYDDEKKQSLMHFECNFLNPAMKNAILSYVYNVLPQDEKDVIDAIKLVEEDQSESGIKPIEEPKGE